MSARDAVLWRGRWEGTASALLGLGWVAWMRQPGLHPEPLNDRAQAGPPAPVDPQAFWVPWDICGTRARCSSESLRPGGLRRS